jgi:hypothetical protein
MFPCVALEVDLLCQVLADSDLQWLNEVLGHSLVVRPASVHIASSWRRSLRQVHRNLSSQSDRGRGLVEETTDLFADLFEDACPEDHWLQSMAKAVQYNLANSTKLKTTPDNTQRRLLPWAVLSVFTVHLLMMSHLDEKQDNSEEDSRDDAVDNPAVVWIKQQMESGCQKMTADHTEEAPRIESPWSTLAVLFSLWVEGIRLRQTTTTTKLGSSTNSEASDTESETASDTTSDMKSWEKAAGLPTIKIISRSQGKSPKENHPQKLPVDPHALDIAVAFSRLQNTSTLVAQTVGWLDAFQAQIVEKTSLSLPNQAVESRWREKWILHSLGHGHTHTNPALKKLRTAAKSWIHNLTDRRASPAPLHEVVRREPKGKDKDKDVWGRIFHQWDHQLAEMEETPAPPPNPLSASLWTTAIPVTSNRQGDTQHPPRLIFISSQREQEAEDLFTQLLTSDNSLTTTRENDVRRRFGLWEALEQLVATEWMARMEQWNVSPGVFQAEARQAIGGLWPYLHGTQQREALAHWFGVPNVVVWSQHPSSLVVAKHFLPLSLTTESSEDGAFSSASSWSPTFRLPHFVRLTNLVSLWTQESEQHTYTRQPQLVTFDIASNCIPWRSSSLGRRIGLERVWQHHRCLVVSRVATGWLVGAASSTELNPQLNQETMTTTTEGTEWVMVDAQHRGFALTGCHPRDPLTFSSHETPGDTEPDFLLRYLQSLEDVAALDVDFLSSRNEDVCPMCGATEDSRQTTRHEGMHADMCVFRKKGDSRKEEEEKASGDSG